MPTTTDSVEPRQRFVSLPDARSARMDFCSGDSLTLTVDSKQEK